MSFYRFSHSTESVALGSRTKKIHAQLPLWIVGLSPFDEVLTPDDGHIVHLGSPKFSARWSISEEVISKISNPAYFDEETNIIIYEVIPLGKHKTIAEKWLLEAACAIGYSKGLIAIDVEDIKLSGKK